MPRDGTGLITVYREALASRHYARRTICAYERWLRRYLRFHQLRHPREMGGQEINAFLTKTNIMSERLHDIKLEDTGGADQSRHETYYVIKVTQGNNVNPTWAGSIKQMKDHTEKVAERHALEINKNIERLHLRVAKYETKDDRVEQEMAERVRNLEARVSDVKTDLSDVKTDLSDIKENI